MDITDFEGLDDLFFDDDIEDLPVTFDELLMKVADDIEDLPVTFDELLMKVADEAETKEVKYKLDDSIWKEKPVNFIEFCRDYVREPLFEGPQEEFAKQVIGEPDVQTFWKNTFKNNMLAWGKGSGKGSLSAKLLTYTAYLLLNMKNPRKFFNIGNTAPIHLLNISYNSQQAKTVFFQGYLVPTVLNTINPKTGCNFFEEKGVDLRVNEGDILSNAIHFERPKKEGEGGITAFSLAGDRGTTEGYSPLIVFIDEISAMQNPEKANQLIDDLEKSANSRFQDFYKIILASFKRGRNCLMSLKVAEAQEKNLIGTYVSIASTWDVNRLKNKEQFATMYERNPVNAARSFEFKEVEGVDENVFFKLVNRLHECFVDEKSNPFDGDVTICRTDQLKILRFKPWFKLDNQCQYHIHIDLAKGSAKDRCGFAMVHKEGFESLSSDEIQKFITGELADKKFKIKTDIILQLLADKELKQIIFEDIRKFIFKLKDMGGKFSITLDGYQSVDFIQQLQAKGFQADLLSVDRDKKCYESLQSLFYRKNIEVYQHPVLVRELEELEESEDGRKIDHPVYSVRRAKNEDGKKDGSKDVSDALCGACFQAILAPDVDVPMMPQKQSPVHQNDEIVQGNLDFETSMYNGSIPVDRFGKPQKEIFGLLMPSKG